MTTRINVLIYAGPGSTTSSVKHATWSLRRLLPNYAVINVSADQILKEPWMSTCALLVMPGGADMGYCRTLNGEGNRRIKQYVQMGGRYLGLCAGGYYGCAKCEFEVGVKGIEVIGERELAFFPGTCKGLAFPGFVYHSEAGMRAAELKVATKQFADVEAAVPERLKAYYNGGGSFVDAMKYAGKGVEILATYEDQVATADGQEGEKAAIVYCKVGEGSAILTGPHPEFSGTNLNRDEATGPQGYDKLVDALVEDEQHRIVFMTACLRKLGLDIRAETQHSVPSLSGLHLTASQPIAVSELLQSWQEAGLIADNVIKGENDTFLIGSASQSDAFDLGSVKTAVATASDPAGGLEPEDPPKTLMAHETFLPQSKDTPNFDHDAFFTHLRNYHSQQKESEATFGKVLIYGEVVTSTSTMLEKNPTWLAELPNGLTATATTQVAGRGRGTNVWVSPPGSLMFSTVMRHSLALSTSAPVVFVQYLAALAIVAGIQSYDKGYARLPIRLKWPNDIYALDPTKPASGNAYVKIGGILVNSSYAGGDYTLIVGIGLNVLNAAPTTSIAQLAAKVNLPAPSLERLLASILANFEGLYTRFCRTGFDTVFEQSYYRSWLHSEQIVTLETQGGVKARIKGISTDWGLLVAEELGFGDRGTGKRWELQSDSNSFDFFRGLVRRKV
ncbi:biotin holocarboxylase synthetase [Oleoguttula sp. CCFEE 5521]